MTRNLRQNVAILVVVMSFFVLSFTTSVESAQTSKKPGKAAPTPAKKTTKPTPAANKKTTAKATPTPNKKTAAKETAAQKKSSAKTPDKKTASKTSTKDSSKDKNSAKNKQTSSKQTTAKTDKNTDKRTDKKTDSKKSTVAKSTKPDTKTATKNSKPVTTAKNTTPTRKELTKPPVKETTTATKSATKIPTTPIETNSGDVPQIIVTDISARIRSQAKAGAPEVTHAKLGTILRVTEKNPAWYKVLYASGSKMSSGWISANSVNDLNSSGKDQLYREITDRYYKGSGMDFTTASELYDFLTRVTGDSGASGNAEIELKRLLALRAALKAIPSGSAEQSPYREFLKSHEKDVVYSEPSGEWLVNAGMFWDLHKKYVKSPLADQIAWEGARNPLPGECEGYVNCHLFYARMTSGEYLSLHPSGKNNVAALNDLTNLLEPIAASLPDKSVYTGPSDVTDRAEFNNLLAELRTIVSRLPLAEKEKPLQQLKKIAEGFR